MPQFKNGACKCPTITTTRKIAFKDLFFEPFVFESCAKNNQLRYPFMSELRGVSGVYIIKDSASNRILHLGSSKKDLYGQVALVVQHYKIPSGETMIAFVKTTPSLVQEVVENIKLTNKTELIDDAFYKIMPLISREETVPANLLCFFDLYNTSPVAPRPVFRLKSNLSHFLGRGGVYVIQKAKKGSDSWSIDYVGKSSDLHKRVHAHFIKSQAEHRPTSNYYHLRKTHDFKIGIIEFPKSEKELIPHVEKYLIKQWDPPGNRYGRGLSKEEISSLSWVGGWKAIENVEAF